MANVDNNLGGLADDDSTLLFDAREGALAVMHHNLRGPCHGLPRTAGWGYPECYTRDWMIAGLGCLVSGDLKLVDALVGVLHTLAQNQSPRGHIPSLAHDSDDRGASDTTPLFLMMLAMTRRATGQGDLLADAADRALTWMTYQSPDDRTMIAQLPTSDWRDEQWVMGQGLFVNSVAHAYLRLLGRSEQADQLRQLMSRFTIHAARKDHHVHEGLLVKHKPYYALWSYKLYSSERFDLLGNSLTILSGVAPPTRARRLVAWIESECDHLRQRGDLAGDCELCPNFFPYIRPGDPDWLGRYEQFNRPGQYHNGGIWPFICGFHIAACVAAGRLGLARRKLLALARLVKGSRERQRNLTFGFNEWHDAHTAKPAGQDWQTWSAAMYLYAFACVQRGTTPFFDDARGWCLADRPGSGQ
jgi:hypothetical protein